MSAFQAQYRNEYIAGFEQKLSNFRASAVTEQVIKGNTAYFLVADSGAATAVTRGANGLIPSRTDNLTQNACTLVEWHDKPRRTDFDIFASQGDGRRILQDMSIGVVNRKLDDLAIAALSAGTSVTSSATSANLEMFENARAVLEQSDVDTDDGQNMFCAVSPKAMSKLRQVPEFSNADYVDVKPFSGQGSVRMRNWGGINFFTSNRLSGRTTNSEKLLMWHRNALGLAINTGEMEIKADKNEEEAYYWARTSVFMGVKLLQDSGVRVILHDATA